METQEQEHIGNNVQKTNNFDYSKAEENIKNIFIPNSIFIAKWREGIGYSIGITNGKLTRDYETLNEALAEVGLKSTEHEDGDITVERIGTIDYDLIGRIAYLIAQQTIELNKLTAKENEH